MQKFLADFNDCNILDDTFLENENMSLTCNCYNFTPQNKAKNLSDNINYFIKNTKFSGLMYLNSELSNKQALFLAKKLAEAIDKNSVDEIKQLKNKYANSKDFAQAKDILNKQCKQIWDVFDKNNTLKAPKEAMKALGITNCPSLEFLLNDSLNFYEKDNDSTTINIIKSILENKNLNYTFDDIFNYIKICTQKTHLKLNQNTIKYLILKTNCDIKKLKDLNIELNTIKNTLKDLSFNKKLKYYPKVFISQYYKT